MIDGFRVDVTAEELAAHLDERIHHHQARAEECAATVRGRAGQKVGHSPLRK
jgi:hypothetical protein